MGAIRAPAIRKCAGSHCLSSAASRLTQIRAAALVGAALLALTPAAAQETISYTYDGRGRLVKTVHSGTANNGVSSCYAYDAADNRTASAVATGSTCVAPAGGAAPSFAINNASATEGGTVSFTVTRSGSTSGSYTLSYATANGTATAGSDYTAKSGSLSFTDGVTSRPVTVSTLQDTIVEGNETFFVDLSNASGGASITTARGTGTIIDDDTAGTCAGVSFTIASNGAVTEGANSIFTVTKSGTTSSSCSVNYATANGTAAAPGDYTAKSGTLTYTASQTSKTVSVTTIDDTVVESAETFKINLSNATGGATLGTPNTATATINDNDGSSGPCAGVSFSVGDASAVEGSPLIFYVAKSGSTSSSCSVNYATADGTATAPAYYTSKSGTLTFTSTQTWQTVSVTTKSTWLNGLDSTYMLLNLSSTTGGSSIADGQGVGTIHDDGGGGGGGGCNPICPAPAFAPDDSAADEEPGGSTEPTGPSSTDSEPPMDATEPGSAEVGQ